MRSFRSLIIVALTLIGSAAAHAQELQLTLTSAQGTGAQGSTVIFRASVKNNSGKKLFLNQLSVTFPGTDLLTADPTEFYTNFAGPLEAGAEIKDKPLFSVTIDTSIAAGIYSGTVAILGGDDEQSLDNLAQVDFQVEVTADNAPPDTIITTGPDENGIVCTLPVAFQWTGADSITPTADLLYSYRLDGGSWSDYSGNTSATFSDLANGAHTFEVKAKDPEGNEDPTPATRHFTVDTLALAISSVQAAQIGAGSADILWETNKPATSQVEYGPTEAYGSVSNLDTSLVTAHKVTLSGLSPSQTYHYRVKSTDICGHESVSPDATFATTPDTTPPHTVFTSGPDDNGKACATTVTFCWMAADDTTPTDRLQYAYKMDSDDWSGWSANTCQTFNNLAEGLHTLQVRAQDAYGNVETSPATRSFFVDLTAPTLSNVKVDPRDYKARVSWTTSEPATSQVEYGETASYGSATPLDSQMDGAHLVLITGLTPQTTYHFRVKSSDGCQEVVSEDQTFTTTEILKPNLGILKFSFPGESRALDNFDASCQVQNKGPGDAKGSWTDRIYFSEDQVLDTNDILLGTFNIDTALPELEIYSRTTNLQMPPKPAGHYYLILITDAENTIAETDEGDNSKALLIEFLKVSSLIAAPGQIPASLHPGRAIKGQLDLGNLLATALTGITAVVENASPNISIQVNPPSMLNGMEVRKVDYSVIAADESVLKNSPMIHFTSSEGEEAQVTLDLTVVPRRPQLVVTPGSLNAGMLRGKQTFVECEIANTGSVAAGDLIVTLPTASWLALVTPDKPGNIAPGEQTKITLSLTPAQDQQLGPYTGTIAVNGSNTNVEIGFDFNCVSDGKGDLKVIGEDEFTFFADTKPPVAGARVLLKGRSTGDVVAEGTTDEAGLFERKALPEGFYNIEVGAPKHGTFKSTVEIVAGQEREIRAFLPRELVTYTWNVVPVDTEDRYLVTLEAVFETHVPAPVVTISPLELDARKLAYDASGKAMVYYTITNHGFITALNCTFRAGENSSYSAVPAIQDIGSIPALTTLVIPVTIYRKQGIKQALLNDCQLLLPVGTLYYCGKPIWRSTFTIILTGECTGGPGPGGGGGGEVGPGPGVVVSPPQPVEVHEFCDPCVQAELGAMLKCAVDICAPGCRIAYNETIECLEDVVDLVNKGDYLGAAAKFLECRKLFKDWQACLKSLQKNLPSYCLAGLANVDAILDCVYSICHACDNISGGTSLGTPSTQKFCEYFDRFKDLYDPIREIVKGLGDVPVIMSLSSTGDWFRCTLRIPLCLMSSCRSSGTQPTGIRMLALTFLLPNEMRYCLCLFLHS